MSARRWILYTRVSTEDQALGASLDAQLAACRAFAQAKGWGPVEAISDPGVSGKSLERPGARAVLSGAKDGTVAGVIVWRLDRWTRSLRDLIDSIASLEAAGTAFVSVTESIDTSGPMGRFTLHLMGALAQLERETISQRIRMAIHQRMAEGRYIGGRVPVGLLINKDRRLEADPAVAQAVAACWRMVKEGKSLLDCGCHLEQARVRGAWTKSRVSWLLRCQKYRGLLVTAEDQDQALAALSIRPSPGNRKAGRLTAAAPNPSNRVWRLHGLAVCRRCGSALVGSHGTGNGGPRAYLRCGGRMRGNGCEAPDMPAKAYEDRVVLEVSRDLGDGAAVLRRMRESADLLAKQAAPAVEERGRLARERDALQATLDRALTLALRGGPTARAVEGRIAELQEQIETCAMGIAAAEGAIAAAGASGLDVEATAAAVAQYAGALPALSVEEQALAMRRMVRSVRLDAEGMELDLSPADSGGMVRREGAEWLPGADCPRTIWRRSVPLVRRRGWKGRWELLAG